MTIEQAFISNSHLDEYGSRPLADYDTKHLTAYLLKHYSSAPINALDDLLWNNDIGNILYLRTKCLLKGMGYDKIQ